VIFPKTPIIIAKNLNTTDEIRISLGTVEKCDELFGMVVSLMGENLWKTAAHLDDVC
jgi:hypothetical protein